MARRRVGALEALLESWARWCDRPAGFELGASGRSTLARWMDSKGDLRFDGGRNASTPNDAIETEVDTSVHILALRNPMAADVLRLEADAGWREVVTRHGVAQYDPRGIGQMEKALALRIGLRTYRRRLAEARAHVAAHMKVKP